MLRKKLVSNMKDNETTRETRSTKKLKLDTELKEINTNTNTVETVSKYFTKDDMSFARQFLNIQFELNEVLASLKFKAPVAYCYNPTIYAAKGNEAYVRKYCNGPKKMLFVGMNPGPFGMCQTGVPFGAIPCVRDWLGIEEDISKPEKECPNRPVQGFACKRVEVSGDRLWNFFKKVSDTSDNFFKNSFVFNYCPLAFMKNDGCNVTPSEMKGDSKLLEDYCDAAFLKVIKLINPEVIIGIGGYAEKRTSIVLKNNNPNGIKILNLVHPSPRVKNNHTWSEKAEKFFTNNNLIQHFK